MPQKQDRGVAHLRAAGVSVVIDVRGPRLPRIVHWGSDLGDLDGAALTELARAAAPAVMPNAMDEVVPVGVLPEAALGWAGTPGISGHRAGTAFSPLFEVRTSEVVDDHRLEVQATDDATGLGLDLTIELLPSGLVRTDAVLTNTGESEYTLDRLAVGLPVPPHARELLDLTGRWSRERVPQRHAFTIGTHTREGRRGRTGTDASLVLAAGEPGFGFRRGEVWAVHTAWSGNYAMSAERLPMGAALLLAGELLLPGEVVLAAGESYAAPTVFGAYGDGLDAMSGRFHTYLRARPEHPRSARKVILNTWEAVYFNHDLDKLVQLAEAAAEVGVERFVLDDGWFLNRRHDAVGLGDWIVDPKVWPQGLHPLVAAVRGLGMEFGLWVEPEMISPDSDLARAHPDWIMGTGTRTPPLSRGQQVLDLANPAAYAHILGRLDALVTEYGIDYLKWDHNRDLVDAGHPTTGHAGVHDQTLAVYRLFDDLRRRHPHLEIESCSSGGGRVDLGVLAHTDRVWASDCIDALERQQIQRWTGLLLPPELVGSHVGSPVSHTTGRTHNLAFRAGTALFGHFGIEWDLTAATPAERSELAAWVAAYKELRALLHTGQVVRVDHPDAETWVHGVVAADRSEAVFAVVAMATTPLHPPGRVVLPGLDPDGLYDVAPLTPDGAAAPRGLMPPWWSTGLRLTGSALAGAGLQVPQLKPEQLVLIRATRVADGPAHPVAVGGPDTEE